MYWNCASRSGCALPSRVFRLAWRLYPKSWSRRLTVRSLTGCPCARRAAANWAALLHVHRSRDIGSPRVTGSTKVSRACRRCGSCRLRGLRPPPRWRTRAGEACGPDAVSARASSCKPARMVPRESPVASATRLMPPRPMARASTAAHTRRARSSKSGLKLINFAAMASLVGFCIGPIVTH